jgi:hypothetical protein
MWMSSNGWAVKFILNHNSSVAMIASLDILIIWLATEIAGPDLDDASEAVRIPVGYVDEFQWVGY